MHKSSPWGQPARKEIFEGKREAVLHSAARIFSELGYHGTSLDLVAEELGITRPTVYYYFKNKDEILFECVRIGLQKIENEANKVNKQGGTAAQKMEAVIYKYAEIMMMDFGKCLIKVGDQPLPLESRYTLRKMQADIDHNIRAIITQGVDEKVFKLCDPKLTAFAVAGSLNSIARWHRADGKSKPDEIAEHFATFLMNGLEVGDSTTK